MKYADRPLRPHVAIQRRREVAADVGARLALHPTQIPVGIVTGLIGGPYFRYLMRKRGQMGEL